MKNILLISAFALLAGAAYSANNAVQVNGVTARLTSPPGFISSNDIATVTAVNATNAVQDALISSKASTNVTDALAATNSAQDISIALRATIVDLTATSNSFVVGLASNSADDRAYADGLSNLAGLTNGVGSNCTVVVSNRKFTVIVSPPSTNSAESIGAALDDHKTNAISHAALLTGYLGTNTTIVINGEPQYLGNANFTVTGVTAGQTNLWNDVTNKLDISATNGLEFGSHSLLVTNTDPRLTDSRPPTAHTQSVSTITGLGNAARSNAVDFASAAQGALADSAVQHTETSVALGFIATAAGNALAVGEAVSAGDYSTVIGGASSAGMYSTALGFVNSVGNRSFSQGDYNNAGAGSVAIGTHISIGNNEFVWGSGTGHGEGCVTFAGCSNGFFLGGGKYYGDGSPLTGVLHPGDSNTNLVNGAGYLTNEPVLIAQNTASLDPTGWQDQDNITVNYTSSNTVILSHAGGLTNWWRGVPHGFASPWQSTASPTTNGTYYLAFRDNGTNPVWSTTPWTFDMSQISILNIASNWSFAIRENHGMGMDHGTHAEFHANVGTYRLSGLTAWGYTLNSDTATAKTPGIDAGVIEDEDLETVISGVSTGGPYTHLMFLSSNTTVFATNQTTITRTGTGAYGMYNPLTAGTFSTNTEMVAGRFVNYYAVHFPVCASANCQLYRTVILQPQVQYTSLAAAQAEDFRSLNLGDLISLAPEFVPYARLTFDTSGSYAQTPLKQRLQAVSYVVGSKATTVSISGTLTPGVTVLALDGTTNITGSTITAGTLTLGTLADPVLTPFNLSGRSVSSTCTITRAWGNSLYINPTGTVYFAADAGMTSTNVEAGFALNIFYGTQTFGFVSASMTNTATLVSNQWNNIIFWKGYGATNFIGR